MSPDTATMPLLFNKRPSQHERILAMLRTGDCLTSYFCRNYLGASFRTRISEMNLWGWAVIESTRHDDGNYRYHLVSESEIKTKPKKAKAA